MGRVEPDDIDLFVEQFYRNKWREIIAVLTHRFGTDRLDDIENAVQRAMEKALASWRVSGMPKNPGGWLYTTAKNDLLDGIRHQRQAAEKQGAVITTLYPDPVEPPSWFGPLDDDVLRMIFVCCHPRLNAKQSVAITLRYICGLGPSEIAGALLLSDVALRKLITRTKAKIRERPIPFDLPGSNERSSRLDRVLQIIYLLFGEGYAANSGDQLVRHDLCREAIRLLELLQKTDEAGSDGRVWALAALMHFQIARLPARIDDTGQPILLADQDRRIWDQMEISHGFACLEHSTKSDRRSRYHLEAAIAACHAASPSFETTEWRQILTFYDDLINLTPSPIVALNRSVAVMMIDGPGAAIELLEDIKDDRKLKHYPLFSAVLADFYRRADNPAAADQYYQHAIAQTSNVPLQRFLADQRNSLSIA